MFSKIFTEGKFEIGCNYWASHAGIEMWSRWDEAVVEADLKRLKDAKIRIIRMFPLWPDFQPIKMHYKGALDECEMRIGEDPLDLSTPEGRAGVDPVMVERFETFCRLAEKYDMKLVVGLLTGWMSGRMFVPTPFERFNLHTNPEAVMWEIKFVRYMVRRFKNEKAILAWDLGNECNCLSRSNKYEFTRWCADISMAIRSEDGTRPVVSGMHGLRVANEERNDIRMLREEFDVDTTHPYPLFTPHCNTDPIGEMKSCLHATAESVMTSDISGNPCIVEEIGTLGTMMVSDEIGGYYARASAISSWAHDLRCFLWWCANEQSLLTHTPYDWNAVERELGLFRLDGTPKPVCESLTSVQTFVDGFEAEFGKLPARITDAVCVLTREQDTWAAAYGTFLLAKQAGLDLKFCFADDTLPDSDVYLIPSINGTATMNKAKYEQIFAKVAEGATLYMSNDSMVISDFERISGNRVDTSVRAGYTYSVDLPCGEKAALQADANIVFTPVRSEVICRDENGNAAFTVAPYGKGKVYYCNYPIERIAGTKPNAIDMPLYSFYTAMDIKNPAKISSRDDRFVGITEHVLPDGRQLLVMINYDKNDREANVSIGGRKLEKVLTMSDKTSHEATSDGFKINIEHNSCAVAVIAAI